MIAKSDYEKAVADGLLDLRRYVDELRYYVEKTRPEDDLVLFEVVTRVPISNGRLIHPLADRSVNETIRAEIDRLIDKYKSR